MPEVRRDTLPAEREIRGILWMCKFSCLQIYKEHLKKDELYYNSDRRQCAAEFDKKIQNDAKMMQK